MIVSIMLCPLLALQGTVGIVASAPCSCAVCWGGGASKAVVILFATKAQCSAKAVMGVAGTGGFWIENDEN